MHFDDLSSLLRAVAAGTVSAEEAATRLQGPPDLMLDTWRCARTGVGEVVYGQGKTLEQIRASLADWPRPWHDSETNSSSTPTLSPQ